MNHIYRLIWNTALGCWTVASEHTKGRGKRARAVRLAGTVAAAVVLAVPAYAQPAPGPDSAPAIDPVEATVWPLARANPLFPALAFAEPGDAVVKAPLTQLALLTDSDYRNSTLSGDNLLVLGSRSSIVGSQAVGYGNGVIIRGNGAVGIGTNAQVSANYGTALGWASKAHALHTTAIGADARATAASATAIGYNAAAGGQSSIAVGTGSNAQGFDAIAVGWGTTAASQGAIAIGINAGVNTGAGINGVAVGNGAHAGTPGYTGATALGGESVARYDGVSVGHGATSEALGSVALGRASVANVANTVSVGNATLKRRIVNMADGTLSAESSDGVTGKQLFAANEAAKLVSAKADQAKAAADAATLKLAGTQIAFGEGAAATGTRATAVGVRSTASGRLNAIAMGTDAKASGDSSSLAIGVEAQATNVYTVAVGHRATAQGGNAMAFGYDAVASGNHGIAMGAETKASGLVSLAIGGDAQATAVAGIAVGRHSRSLASNAVALGDGAIAEANAAGAVALGQGAVATVANTLSVGSATQKRKIVNVDEGAVGAGSSEAVTGSQLHATQQAMAANATLVRNLITEASSEGTVRLGIGNTGNRLDVRNQANGNRVITGLVDGAVNASSTEAVTGSQLHATNSSVSKADTTAAAAQAAAVAATTAASAAQASADLANGLVGQVSASGNVRLGARNTGRTLDVRNQTDQTRVLSGLSDGAVGAASTDAVTGAQLHRTDASVVLASESAQAADDKAVASQATANTAATAASAAMASAMLANGLVGQVSASGDVRIGAQNAGRTLDVRNQADQTRVLSGLSDGAVGAASSEAVTGRQLHATQQSMAANASLVRNLVTEASTDGTVRLGIGNSGNRLDVRNQGNGTRVLTGLSNGALNSSSTEAVTGGQLYATNASVSRADDKAIAAQAAAAAASVAAGNAQAGADLANGLVGQVTSSSALRLGAQNSGRVLDVRNQADLTRRVSGVSDGTLGADSTDAVTGSQLFATNEIARQQQAAVEDNARYIADNRGDIDSNLTGIGDNRTAIDGNRTAIGINGTSIDANRLNIGVNRDSIAALRSEFEDFAPDLDGVVTFNEDRTEVGLEGARIGGLAAGDATRAESEEAVNGGQLFATNTRIAAIEESNRFLSIGSGPDGGIATAAEYAVALGESAEASANGAVALGSFSIAAATSSVALGRGAYVDELGMEGFALGTATRVSADSGLAVGAKSVVETGAENSVALGNRSVVTEINAVSVGNETLKRRIVNIAPGLNDDNATTVAQIRGVLDGLGGDATIDAVGIVTRPEYVLSTNTYDNVGDALLALDTAIGVNQTDVDTLAGHIDSLLKEESSARSNAPGRLLLGGGHGMVLGNVADGRVAADSRDAVNGSQLHATNQKVGENRTEISDLRAALDVMQPRTVHTLMAADAPVVNFGGSRLSGLGAGDVLSADSTDAVNGGQLYGTNVRVASIEKSSKYISIGSNEQSNAAFASEYGVAVGSDARADGHLSTALGRFAQASGMQSIALGNGSYVAEDGRFGFAVGAYSNVLAEYGLSIGGDTIVDSGAKRSVALGFGSLATEADTVSIGSSGLKRRIVNVANGTADHDAATVGQLKRIATVFGGSVDANGTPVSPSFTVQGGEYRTVGDALTALDTSVQDNEKSLSSLDRTLNRLFQEGPTARSDGPGRLNLGGTHGMVLGNVANGLIAAGSRDAVNGGQLYEVQKNLQGQIDTLEGRDNAPVAMTGRMGAPVALSSDAPTTTGDAPTPTSDVAPPPAPVETPVAKVDTPEPVVKAEGDTAVAVGSEGKERSVKHVAKGTADTDAANVGQLNDVLERANGYTDVAVEGLNKRLDGMDKRFNRMAAMSSAQSAMAMNTAGLNTYNRLGAGVGHSDGESALAVGYQRVMNERGSATFSLNGAFTNSGEKTVGVGVGIGW